MEYYTDISLYSSLKEHLHVDYPDARSIRSYNLLTLAAFLPFFSAESFCNSIHYLSDKKTIQTYLNRLLKDGYIKKLNLPKKDFTSNTLYYLTSLGYETIAPNLNGLVNFKRKTGLSLQKIALHDYYIGEVFLQYLSTPYYLDWRLDVLLSHNTTHLNKHRVLRVDAIMTLFQGTQTIASIYVEQDTGSETILDLYDKLEKYAYYELLNHPHNYLLFAFRKSHVVCDEPCFTPTKIQELIPFFPNDLSTLVSISKDQLTERQQLTRSSLLSLSKDFTKQTLLEHIQSLKNGRNEVRLNAYYAKQLHFTNARRNTFIMALQANNRLGHSLSFHCFLSGASVYCAPTTRLVNFIPLFHYATCNERVTIEQTLMNYYVSFQPSSYQEHYLNERVKSEYLSITFCNTYTYSYGTVSVEYISRDLGAYVRADYFMQAIENNYPHNLVLLVEHLADAIYFSDALQFKIGNSVLLQKRKFLSFLIPSEGKLFTIDQTNKKHYLPTIYDLEHWPVPHQYL